MAAVVDLRLWLEEGRESGERLRWLVSVKTCGEKTSVVKSAGGLQFVLSVGFFSSKSVWVLYTADHWELWSLILCGWYWQLLPFFLVTRHL